MTPYRPNDKELEILEKHLKPNLIIIVVALVFAIIFAFGLPSFIKGLSSFLSTPIISFIISSIFICISTFVVILAIYISAKDYFLLRKNILEFYVTDLVDKGESVQNDKDGMRTIEYCFYIYNDNLKTRLPCKLFNHYEMSNIGDQILVLMYKGKPIQGVPMSIFTTIS